MNEYFAKYITALSESQHEALNELFLLALSPRIDHKRLFDLVQSVIKNTDLINCNIDTMLQMIAQRERRAQLDAQTTLAIIATEYQVAH